ncbi:MAG: COG1361 S-layer family protein, partial [Candidatus Geothermarchaeales archaeon]
LIVTVAHAKGEVVVSGANATLILPIGFEDWRGKHVARDSALGSYGSGKGIDFDFTINIAENLPLGLYYGYLRIEFYLLYGGMTFEGDPWNMSIPIKLLGKTDINYRLDPQTLSPSAVNDVKLTVSNNGSAPAYFLDIAFSAEKTTPIGGEASWTVQKLAPGQGETFPLSLYVHRDLQGGKAEASVATTYKSVYDRLRTQTDTIHFTVASLKDRFEIAASSTSLAEAQVNDVSLTLRYSGTEFLDKVRVSASAEPPAAVVGSEEWVIDRLVPGQEVFLATQIYAPGAGESTTLTLSIKYADVMGVEIVETSQLGFIVYSGPEGATLLRLGAVDVKAGLINEVYASLINNRNREIMDVEINAAASAPFGIVGLSTWSTPSLRPGGSKDLSIDLYAPSASSGSTSYLTFTVKYTDEVGKINTESHYIGFVVGEVSASPLRLRSDTPHIYAGSLSNYNLILQNLRDAPIGNLEVTVKAPPSVTFVSTDGRWSFEALGPGESKTLVIPVFATEESIGAGESLTVELSYIDENGIYSSESRTLGFAVRGTIDLRLSGITITPLPAMPGSTLTISGQIFNSGTVTAKAVSVTAAPSHPFLFMAMEGTMVVGDIDVGFQAPFTLNPTVSPEAEIGTYKLQLLLTYKDDMGVWQEIPTEIPVTIGKTPGLPAREKPTRERLIPLSWVDVAIGITMGVVAAGVAMKLISRRRRSREGVDGWG